MGGDFSFILYRPFFLKSGQLITGSTSLLYKGSDGIARSINPNNYQPVGSYATTAQLNELKTSVSNGKSAVASAITDKGVSTSATASFNTMANNIRKIVTSNIYNINNFNNELISDDKITHCPCYEYGGSYITYHAENTSLERGKNYFYFNMKLNNYTQVELYTGANSYPLYLSIYEYNPGDFSTIVLKAPSLSGYYNGYKNLGFTTNPNKLYLLRVSGGNSYMGCRFK